MQQLALGWANVDKGKFGGAARVQSGVQNWILWKQKTCDVTVNCGPIRLRKVVALLRTCRHHHFLHASCPA
jgi:hypothetical protein